MTRPLRIRTPIAVLALCFIALITIPSLFYMSPKSSISTRESRTGPGEKSALDHQKDPIFVDPSLDVGGTIMPQLGNATAKAELGRATWKLVHTMASRYPVKPTQDERAAVKQWIYLLSRLYPCGECAEHFQAMLKDHPPQTSSRAALSNWACAVHNIVNARLGKPEFDCSTLADVYKCGCADEGNDEEAVAADPI
ncbi:hypothetical protein BGZ58_008105 [Dissophora ornata]|nr:hypothetical protein BGZ58_008105 [Dissophora ornata]